MPAHTQTRRGVDKHTDRHMSPDNTALGFGPPESSCLPVQGSPYRMACTAHQTRDQERNSLSRRAGCLPARSLASVLRRLERPIRSPFIESFLLRQIPSCFSAGPRIYTGLSCPAWAPVLCLFFPSVLELFSFPGQGIPDEPPNVMPAVQIPQQEEKTSMTMQHAKEGKFNADSSQGLCCNQCSGAKSESPESQFPGTL